MAPKGGNAKKESGRAKKAENESKKREAVTTEKEKKEAVEWEVGAKGKSKADEREEKRKADLARKAENARLLAEEEAAQLPKAKVSQKAGKKPATGTKAVASESVDAGSTSDGRKGAETTEESEAAGEVESFAATGIDNALDLLDVVTAKMDKASIGQQAAAIERHPERRFKAAYEAYQERELPTVKIEHPGLRLQQYKDILYKQFQKSTENPFNQTTIAYDATKEEKVEALRAKKAQVEERLREKAT